MFPSIWFDPQVSRYHMWYWAAVACGGPICPNTARHLRPRADGAACRHRPVRQRMCGAQGHGLWIVSPVQCGDPLRRERGWYQLHEAEPEPHGDRLEGTTWYSRAGKYVLDGFSVLLDERDPDASRRWKLVSFSNAGHGSKPPFTGKGPKLLLAVSADGFHWTNWTATIHDGRWDTYPSSLWDSQRQQYVVFDRLQPGPPKQFRTEAYLH